MGEWAGSHATFVDIFNLKGRVKEGVVVDWSSLLVDDAAEPEMSCSGSMPMEGELPEQFRNNGVEADYRSMKISYLVYMDSQKYARAIPLDGQAHREIQWLSMAGITTVR